MASLVLGNLGSSLLGPLGGFIGSALGSYIDQWLFAPKPPDIEGPRVQDLNAIRADPGTPIPIVYGADRVPGIIIDTTELIETKHKKKIGGKGGKRQSQISYTYHVDIDFMLCEGPILGVGRIWADGKLIRGTRYAMELQAEDNPERVGAMPYSSWYTQHYYDERLLPWSLDPSYTPSLSAEKYTYNSLSDTYTQITSQAATDILDDPNDVTVVYSRDNVTGYYIPVPPSHQYTGETVKECLSYRSSQEVTSQYTPINPVVPSDDYSASQFYTQVFAVPEAGPDGAFVEVSGIGQKSGLGPVTLLLDVEPWNSDGQVFDPRDPGEGPYSDLTSTGDLNLSLDTDGEAYTVQFWAPPGTTELRYTFNIAVFIPLSSAGRTVDALIEYTTTQVDVTETTVNVNIPDRNINPGDAQSSYRDKFTNNYTVPVANSELGGTLTLSIAFEHSNSAAPGVTGADITFYNSDNLPINFFDPNTGTSKAGHSFQFSVEAGAGNTANTESNNYEFYVPPGTTRIEYEWFAGTDISYPTGTEGSLTTTGSYSTFVGSGQTEVCENVRNWSDYQNLYDALNDWSPSAVLSFDGVDGVTLYRGTQDQISDPTMQLVHSDLSCDVPAYIGRAHIVFQRLELEEFGNRIPNLSFEVVQSDNARIKTVLTDLFERAEVEPELYDLSALPNVNLPSHVLGYSIARVTSFRAAMETLLEAFQIDAAEMGDQLVFRPRSRGYDHIIDYNDLAAVSTTGRGSTNEPITLTFRDQIDMPKRLTVRFKDPEREYQVNSAAVARQFTPSVQESGAELAAVIPPLEAKRYARDKLRDLWLERRSGSWTTPHKYAYVSPTDLVLINGSEYGANDYIFKVAEVNRAANGILSMTGVMRETTVYSPVDGETDNIGTFNSFVSQIGGRLLPVTYLELLDLPALRTQDDSAGFYFAMCGQSTSWQGATLQRRITTASAYEPLELMTNDSIIGRVSEDPLGYAPPTTMDRNASVVVQLYNSTETLVSVTPDELLSGFNTAVMGDEIIQFMTVADLGDGRWRLSNIIRGHLDTGTQEILSGHASLERFILLDATLIGTIEDDIDMAYDPYNYKGVTLGGQTAQFPQKTFTNNASRLRPFRPMLLTGTRDGSNNLTISWTRQDRLERAMVDGTDLPINEDFERYEIDIISSGGGVLRTLQVEDATSVLYDAATQTSDGLTPGDPITIKAYQMSAIVGRGNEASGEV